MQFPLITAFCSRHWFSKITLSYRLGSVAGGRGISYRVVGERLLILFHFPVLLKEHCFPSILYKVRFENLTWSDSALWCCSPRYCHKRSLTSSTSVFLVQILSLVWWQPVQHLNLWWVVGKWKKSWCRCTAAHFQISNNKANNSSKYQYWTYCNRSLLLIRDASSVY